MGELVIPISSHRCSSCEGNIVIHERLETMGNGNGVEFLLCGVLLDGSNRLL